jgi:hypothetical protein
MPSNNIMRRVALRAATSAVVTLFASFSVVPGFAQSDSDCRSRGVMRIYAHDQDVAPDQAMLPPNMNVTGMYRELLASMLKRSATFRRQCLRIARAERLQVELTTFKGYDPARVRARARLEFGKEGRLFATIEIRPLDDSAELIAHEIEHVIEWLDGVDLRTSAARRDSGVEEDDGGRYETVRAVRVGLMVSKELHEHLNLERTSRNP